MEACSIRYVREYVYVIERTVMAMTQAAALLASIDETVETLQVSRNSVYKLLDAGDLRAVKIGSRRMIVRKSIEEFVEQGE
jgi:excisionase family DNA binding protein